MKIVHMTSAHPVFDTRIFHKECLWLYRNGFAIVLIAPHPRNENVHGVRIVGVTPGRKRFGRMLLTTFEVFFKSLRERAELYHLHDPELMCVGQLLRIMGRRVVFDMHENLPKAILSKKWIMPRLRPLISICVRSIERLLLWRVPTVFAEVSYLQDYTWVEECEVVLNLPDIDYLVRVDEEKYPVPTVGYVGSVTPERGSIITLKALEILYRRGLVVNFDCVGPVRGDEQLLYMKDMDRRVCEGIRLIGYLSPTEAWKRISRCHIGLALLKPEPNYFESYPTKMFEYMALGLPVVVSDFPLYREIVDRYQCGICVDPGSPVAVADALEELILNPEKAHNMGMRGRQAVVDRFNWSYEARKLCHFYKKILSRAVA